jgi:hypothetical protein
MLKKRKEREETVEMTIEDIHQDINIIKRNIININIIEIEEDLEVIKVDHLVVNLEIKEEIEVEIDTDINIIKEITDYLINFINGI